MLREILARFGIDVDNAQIITGISSLGQLAAQALQAARMIAGALFQAIRSLTVEMAEMGDEVAKTARQLGISADALSRWRFAAERSGVPAEQLTNGLRRLQRNIVDAGEGMDTAVRAFRDLDVAFRDGEGGFREIEDILPEIADGFSQLESDTQRSARAQQLFGRAGAQLLPFFENGSEGIAELEARFNELTGGGFGDFFELSEEAQDSMADFDLAITALKAAISTELLPAFTSFSLRVSETLAAFREAIEGTNLLKAGLIALGVTAAIVGVILFIVFIKPIVVIAAIIAIIGIWILVFDDLITFIEQGDSALGRFIDQMFGAGTAVRFIDTVKDAFARIVDVIENDLMPATQQWIELFTDRVGPAITSVLDRMKNQIQRIIDLWLQGVQNIRGSLVELRESLDSALGVIGIELSDVPGVESADRVAAPIRNLAGGGDTNVDQTNNVTINAADLSPEEIQRRVSDAISEGNERALRVANRALTQIGA